MIKKRSGLAKLNDIRSLPAMAWEEVDCIICGKQTQTTLVWPDRERGDIVRCNRCDLVYRNPRRREDDQIHHFEEEWTESRPSFQLEDYRSGNLNRIVKWILNKHTSPGVLLDIGSSYGTLLAQLPKTWELFGVEPSRVACYLARNRLPQATIINATLGDAKLPDKSFDVITLVDTIYYLPYPLRDLGRLPDLLRPGGIILIEAPNFTNRRWVYRLIKHHFDDTWMFFYTPKSLEKMLNKAGMKVVDRFYLPGHQAGGEKILSKILALAEYFYLQILKNITFNQLDLLPHFVLVAQPVKQDGNKALEIERYPEYRKVNDNIIDYFHQWVTTKLLNHNVKMTMRMNSYEKIRDVVKMHMEYLPTSFKKNYHLRDLLFYYYEVAKNDQNNVLITVEADGLLVGYICLIESHRLLYLKILKKYRIKSLVKSVLTIPLLQKNMFKAIRKRLLITLSGEYNRISVAE